MRENTYTAKLLLVGSAILMIIQHIFSRFDSLNLVVDAVVLRDSKVVVLVNKLVLGCLVGAFA